MQRYSSGAVLLHWLIAIALAFQLALGFAMPSGAEGFALYQLHKSVGIAILLLTLVRLGWRLTHRPPAPIEGGWQHALANAVHVSLYAFMILTPLAGWALVSTAEVKVPTLLFGTIPWPHLPLPDSWGDASEAVHELLAWFGIALIALHIAGALRHHLLLRDGLLQRMAPGGSVSALASLVLLGVAIAGATLMLAGGSRTGPTPEGGQETRAMAVEDALGLPVSERAEQPDSETADVSDALDGEDATDDVESTSDEAGEPGPPPVWEIQPGGHLAFSVANGGNTISGSFSQWSGDIRFDPANPETADIRIRIDLTSASVGDASQDGMLRGPEFFDAGSSPTATWRSTSVTGLGSGRYRAQGTLDLKGVSRSQTLDFTLSGDGMRRRVDGSATINRDAFGIGGSSASGVAPAVSLTFGFDAAGSQP